MRCEAFSDSGVSCLYPECGGGVFELFGCCFVSSCAKLNPENNCLISCMSWPISDRLELAGAGGFEGGGGALQADGGAAPELRSKVGECVAWYWNWCAAG